MDNTRRAVILIPSLEPDDRLIAYADRLMEGGFRHIVIVDDGSSEKYQPIFSAIDAKEGCTVLHHGVNRGKGCALKTGYAFIKENYPDAAGIITADADGQHTVEDCIRLSEKLMEGKDAMYLGSRDFDLPDIPPKSRFGNKTTSMVFKLLYGCYLPDTQTGLRAFPMQEIDFMMEVEGDRFEYEMNVLIASRMKKLEMIPVTITTVYENENAGTHFHPIRDSWRIYKVIFAGFFRYMGASLLSFLLDQGLAWLLSDLLGLPIAAGNVGARIVSGGFNFALNRSFVFKSKAGLGKSGLRYLIVWAVVLLLSTVGIQGLCSLFNAPALRWLFKLICDTVLYFLSYQLQRNWVFAEEKK